jgi:hypothetical protein
MAIILGGCDLREEWARKVTFYRHTVGLVRDSVLILIGILTVVITLMGGDPGKLKSSDWAYLVGAALSIVIVPLVCFFVSKAIFGFLGRSLSIQEDRLRSHLQNLDIEKASKRFISRLLRLLIRTAHLYNLFYRYLTTIYPYYLALCFLLVSLFVFWKVLSKYGHL